MATPPRRPTYYFGTEALFPSDGAQAAPGKARGSSTPGADAILNGARPHGPRLPPPIQGAVDYVKDGIQGSFDRVKGDMIGAGADLATKFQPLDRLVSTFQRAGWSASPPSSNQPAPQPAMSDTHRRLAEIIRMGEGNYESYNTGTSGVPGNRVGHSYLSPPAGTVTGKTISSSRAKNGLRRNCRIGFSQVSSSPRLAAVDWPTSSTTAEDRSTTRSTRPPRNGLR